MGETNGNHRSIFSMGSTPAPPPSRPPGGRRGTAKSIARLLVAGMAVAVLALANTAGTELAQAQMNTSTDRVALVALYNAADGDNWVNKDNWLSDRPLGEWHGVRTAGNGPVIGLYLHGNQLGGEIPPELGSLSNLEGLDLGFNQLSGDVPSELGSLSNLRQLRFDGNSSLSGPLPGSFTGLTSLIHLSLIGTGLCVPADAAFQAWLGGIGDRVGVVNCGADP